MKGVYKKDLHNQQWKQMASSEQIAFYEWAVAQGASAAILVSKAINAANGLSFCQWAT